MANKDNSDHMKLSKERLLRSEYEHYRSIGEPDYSQNWLELFTPTIVSDLFTIMSSGSDNTKKKDYIQQELEQYGFEELGLGTNIYAMWHPAYPGVAFKVALDTAGLADNYNDEVLYGLVNKILTDAGKKPRYTKCLMRHPTGIVSVQERKVLMKTQDRMDKFRGSILKTLGLLASHFLIVDMSPSLFQFNYGIERNGDWCFIDASDLYPLENITKKLQCTKAIGSDRKKGGIIRCHGSLRYSEDFSSIICTRCGKEYIPSEFRPNDKEDVGIMANSMLDGLRPEEREAMMQEELAVINRNVRSNLQQPVEPEEQVVVPNYIAINDEGGSEVRQVIQLPEEPTEEPTPYPTVSNISPDDDDEDEEPEETPEPVPVPTPPAPAVRNGVFWNPNGPKPNVNDRSGGVEVLRPGGIEHSVVEPSREILQRMATSFTPVQAVDADDDEDEEDGTVQEVTTNTRTPEAPAETPTMDYQIFTDTDGSKCIMINMSPDCDFDDVYDEHGLGIWVTTDGGKTQVSAVSADALKKLVKQAFEDSIE